jgi:hypothetical protein
MPFLVTGNNPSYELPTLLRILLVNCGNKLRYARFIDIFFNNCIQYNQGEGVGNAFGS